MTTLLEICVDDADGILAAHAGGADRIELCSALELGGLTPQLSLIQIAARLPIPSYAMIRPRAGDFVFSPADEEAMLADIDTVREAGLAGVVLGASLRDGRLDEDLLARLVQHASGLGLTLHRAFDLVPDIGPAIDFAVDQGFERILTSGGMTAAARGVDQLRETFTKAADRISIMPGSGVTTDTIGTIMAAAPFGEVHSSASDHVPGIGGKAEALGFAAARRRVTSPEKVAALKTALNA